MRDRAERALEEYLQLEWLSCSKNYNVLGSIGRISAGNSLSPPFPEWWPAGARWWSGTHTALCKNSRNAILWLDRADWECDMRAPVGRPDSCCRGRFQHPNVSPPQCGRVTMKYLAVLNSAAFEVLFRAVRWATVIACHSSHNELCYVTVIPGQPPQCVTPEEADPNSHRPRRKI